MSQGPVALWCSTLIGPGRGPGAALFVGEEEWMLNCEEQCHLAGGDLNSIALYVCCAEPESR